MNLHTLIFTKNDCYAAGKTITPKGIMVHSTGANNPNLRRYIGPDDGLLGKNAYGNDWNRPGLDVCVHGFIGKLSDGTIATYQTLPWTYRGWHCGGAANNTHISFEICEDDLTDSAYFAAVYQEAAELCAYLCRQYGLTEKDIICHSEGAKLGIASGHADVMHWFPKFGKSMDTFRAAVKALLPATPETPHYYRVRKSWDDAKSQTGAFLSLDNAKNACAMGYTVYDWDGNAVYTPARTYTVRPGDTLWGIAQSYGTTAAKLAAYNGLSDANLILVGQTIKIPG